MKIHNLKKAIGDYKRFNEGWKKKALKSIWKIQKSLLKKENFNEYYNALQF